MKNGIWLYGLSGSGKTYASRYISTLMSNAFLIDGDTVRELISQDLSYDESSRSIQRQRILGLAKIAIRNGCKPIISTVTMSDKIFIECKELCIDVLRIERTTSQLVNVRNFYTDGTSNVVGIDIPDKRFDTVVVQNDGDEKFLERIKSIVK